MCAARLTVGRDCSIDVNCVFEGRVVLGEGVRIGPNCLIRDSEIAGRRRNPRQQRARGGRIGSETATSGPSPGCAPAPCSPSGAKVGNFVETKKAEIGEGSKVNHLSYVGDARLGRNVNVGAGTITCNYDGANKHLTIIEDDAFIGSDTQLVAPVTVGAGATLGAGTTLTQDAPGRPAHHQPRPPAHIRQLGTAEEGKEIDAYKPQPAMEPTTLHDHSRR